MGRSGSLGALLARGFEGANPRNDVLAEIRHLLLEMQEGEQREIEAAVAETREQLGGYYLFDCRDMDEALDWAARIPHAHEESCCVEVRPVMDYAAYGDAPAAGAAETAR